MADAHTPSGQKHSGMTLSQSMAMHREKILSVAYPLIFGIILIALWQGGVLNVILGADDFTLPAPKRIITIFTDNFPTIFRHMTATITVALGGLLLGSLFGYFIAIVASSFPKWGIGALTVISAFNAIPIIAIAPIMNNLTKDFSSVPAIRSMFAKMLVVMITCTVAMSINAYRGLSDLKPYSRDLMQSIAARERDIFFKLKLPNSVPYVFTALRISVPGSIISAMISEYFAEYIIGVGRQIRESIVLAQYSTAWAYIAAAFIIGIVFYAILMVLEGIFLKWKRV